MRTCKEVTLSEKVDRITLSANGSSGGVYGKAYVRTLPNGTSLQGYLADISVNWIWIS